MMVFRMTLALCLVLDPLITAFTPEYELPIVKYSDLLSSNASSGVLAANELITIGAVQITGIPQFFSARKEALGFLASCLQSGEGMEGVASVPMADGSVRRTSAAARAGGKPLPMSSSCGRSSSTLRTVVQSTLELFFRLLDHSTQETAAQQRRHQQHSIGPDSDRLIMGPTFSSFEEISHIGEHLEHLHAYYSGNITQNNGHPTPRDDFLLPLHTDSGLFVAMTSGLVKTCEGSEGGLSPKQHEDEEDEEGGQNELYMRLPSGTMSRVIAEKDALIILAGEGAAEWLAPALGAPIRPVPHALGRIGGKRIKDKNGEGTEECFTRAWYGMMVLPPAEALVPVVTGPRGKQKEWISYKEHRARELGELPDSRVDILPSGCGHSQEWNMFSRRLSSGLCKREDGTSGVMCWTICQAVTDLSCGADAVCTDMASGQEVEGGHCSSSLGSVGCQLACPSNTHSHTDTHALAGTATNDSPGDTSETSFCQGGGYDMFMGGFSSGWVSADCLLLFFSDWTLDTRGKFMSACVGVFSMGLLVEYCTKVRRNLFRKRWSTRRQVYLVCLHGLQVLLAYLLMLAAMSYSSEIFVSVILGLTTGYSIFNLASPPPTSTEPCCADSNLVDSEHELSELGGGDLMALSSTSRGYQKIT